MPGFRSIQFVPDPTPGRPSPGRLGPTPASPHLTTTPNRLNLLLTCGCWRPDSWADRLPAVLEPMGIHSFRAHSARTAERLIRDNPVHVAVVDLGLPMDDPCDRADGPIAGEEAGTRILELLSRLDAPPPTVVVQAPRSSRDASRSLASALRCGAYAVVDRSAADLEFMLEVLRRCMAKFYQGRWPGSLGPRSI